MTVDLHVVNGDDVELLAGDLDRLTLEAAMLAADGVIERESIECVVCSLPLALHADSLGHEYQMSEAYALALRAIEAEDDRFMDVVADGLDAEYTPSGSRSPRPSDAGSCERSVWYRLNPPADYTPRTDIDRKKAALGSIIHKAGETYRPARYPWRRFEMRIKVPGLDGTYAVDEYDPVTGTTYDTKTAGLPKWAILADGPTDAMWDQVRIYAWALYCLGYPVKMLCIVAVNRENGRDETHWEPFDPEVCKAALGILLALGTALDAGIVPDRQGHGLRDWRCQWCEALNHCWNTAAADKLGRGPVSLTLLGAQPEEEAIVWAAREFLRAGAARKELAEREAFLKDLLQGLPSGVYGVDREDGGIEITNKPTTSVGYKEYVELLESLWDLPADQRPTLAELPGPTRTKSMTQSAKRAQRAALGETARNRPAGPAALAASTVRAIVGA